MKYFIFRNYTVEPFFKGIDAVFSGYEDISLVDESVDRYIWFYTLSYKLNEETVATEIANYSKSLEWIAGRLNINKTLLVFTMHRVFDLNFQVIDNRVEHAIVDYNCKVRQLALQSSSIKVIDAGDFYRNYSSENLVAWKFYYISQVPLNPKLASDFKKWFDRQVEIVEQKRKKCIVLDLDNTLWGGILGEDGADGIKIGEGYPGNTYRFFQQYLLELNRDGIILTVCSKNNEMDVLTVWEKHPEMILRKEHFVTYRINWKNKAENIKEIATELNIGLDSIVFVDDNPAERELVKQVLPQVCVPDFPEQPYLYPLFARKLTDEYFRAYQLTGEDLSKTRQYKENAERVQFQNQFIDFENYLRSLEIELTIESLDDYNIVRIAQMTQKTNQFNLTTRRYTETDIHSFEMIGGRVWGLRVKDRFGDNGLTGLLMARVDKNEAVIDSFLLSCRVLGKGIENVFISCVLNKLKQKGIKRVQATYLKTAKNAQVKEFYDKMGFQLTRDTGETREYESNLNEMDLKVPDIYKLVENERKN